MKHIVRLGQNKFIVLDSYGESTETRAWSIAIALLSLLLAAITGGALMGVDITKSQPEVSHHITAD